MMPMKHEPATMKKKADLMLKKGTISETQHKKLHAKADVELDKLKAGATDAADKPVKTPLSATGKVTDAASDMEEGKDTPKADDPISKRGKPGKANVMRGEPADPDL